MSVWPTREVSQSSSGSTPGRLPHASGAAGLSAATGPSALFDALQRRHPRVLGRFNDGALGGQALLLSTGALVMSTIWLRNPDLDQWRTIAVLSLVMLVLAGLAWALPWRRLPAAAAVVFPVTTLASISALSVLGQGIGASYMGVWVMAFLHAGLFLPPVASRCLALAALALFGPGAGGWDASTGLRAAISCTACLLVSEALAALLSRHRAALAQLEALTEIDALTGALNRRGLAYRIAQARPGEIVVMFDLDHFKAINDTSGHHHGDVVLKDFAATLSSLLGPGDSLARYGGEEFCMIIVPQPAPGSPSIRRAPAPGAFARSVEQRVDHVLSEARRLWEVRQPGITFSSGRAEVPSDGLASAAVVMADEALYTAKETGRNRDEVAAPGRQVHRVSAPVTG